MSDSGTIIIINMDERAALAGSEWRRVPRAILGVAVTVVAAAVLGGGCATSSGRGGPTGAGASPRVGVVAAENFWGDIASQIGGDRVAVTSIIKEPGVDPHLYETSTRDAAAVDKARVVIRNGLGYDDFLDRVLGASVHADRVVVSVDTVLDVHGQEANPHLWYMTQRLPAVAAAISSALGRADPAGAALFGANAERFASSLRPILDSISTIKAKYGGAPVAYTERVPGYLLDAAGLSVTSPEAFARAVEAGNDPSPQAVQQFETLLRTKAVKVLLYNSQATSPVTDHIRALARQAGVPVVGVSETIPRREQNFQSWQLHQVTAVLQALGG